MLIRTPTLTRLTRAETEELEPESGGEWGLRVHRSLASGPAYRIVSH